MVILAQTSADIMLAWLWLVLEETYMYYTMRI